MKKCPDCEQEFSGRDNMLRHKRKINDEMSHAYSPPLMERVSPSPPHVEGVPPPPP